MKFYPGSRGPLVVAEEPPARFWVRAIRQCRLFALRVSVLTSVILPGAAAEPSPEPPAKVTLKIDSRRSRIFLPGQINGTGPYQFLLDTGYDLTMVNPALVEELKLEKIGRVEIVGIAGQEWAGLHRGARFQFAGMEYSPRRVAALPAERERRSRRDGILGSGFFRRFVVVIHADAGEVSLHEPKTFEYAGSGEAFSLVFPQETPVIEAALAKPGQTPVRARFEIDTGCDDGVCLGHDFVATNQWLLATGRTRDSFRSGVGGGTATTSGRVPQLLLGKVSQTNVAANFFKDGSPVSASLAGHIGWGAFQHCKVIFDYSRKRMILEPAN